MSKLKLIFLILGILLTLFVLIFAYELLTENYCWNKGDNLPDEEKSIKVAPTEEENKKGIVYQSKYYRIISNCEKQFPSILGILFR